MEWDETVYILYCQYHVDCFESFSPLFRIIGLLCEISKNTAQNILPARISIDAKRLSPSDLCFQKLYDLPDYSNHLCDRHPGQ